jgi:penicillin-binding protein 2
MMHKRKNIVQFSFLAVGLIFLGQLFNIQVLGEDYRAEADENSRRELIDYPYRGNIYDRNGKLIVANVPEFNLMVVPKQKLEDLDTDHLAYILNITPEEFETKYTKARRYSRNRPSVFLKQLSLNELAEVQDYFIEYPNFYFEPRTKRYYPDSSASHAMGYIGEVSQSMLDRDTTKYYRRGDYVGVGGVEKTYERYLRGVRGKRYMLVDVKGVEKGRYANGLLDTIAIPGSDLTSSIDLDLQLYAEKLMEGKTGSLVAIEPATGEILAIVSAPLYDPNQLTGHNYGKNYLKLQRDTLTPLFNRPIMAQYPPGSMFKMSQSLISMQEGVVGPNEQVAAYNSPMGDHAPPGLYDHVRGIKYSSNTFYYHVFGRIINKPTAEHGIWAGAAIGLENWAEHQRKLGLGSPLGIDIAGEKAGFIPDSAFYNKHYGVNRWKYSNIYSLSIGQGEVLVTPIQMANMAAIFANGGYYYIPHIIKGIDDGNKIPEKYRTKVETGFDSAYFGPIREGMAQVVYGTARRAIIEGLPIAGKTSTVQNPHGEDHSGFIAFAPYDDRKPMIAVSAYVENAGWGGRAAASIASLVIEKYVNDTISDKRKRLEEYVLVGEFM